MKYKVLSTNSDPLLYEIVSFYEHYGYSYAFISDNTTKYYLIGYYGRDMFVSTDNGQSFNWAQGPNTQSNVFPNSVRIAAHPTLGLWSAFDNNNDTIHVYYTTNNGTNYFHKHSFFIDLAGAGFDCSFNGNQFLLFYSYEEVGQEKVYLKKITPTSVSSPLLIYTSNDGIYAFDSGNKNDLLGIASGKREFLFSTNNGTSWTKPILLGAELFPSDFYTFSIVNNTTIAAGFLVNESSTSLRNIYHCSIKLTDKPFFTSVTITEPFWYSVFQWRDYVEVTHHQFQLAADEQFTNVLFDTLMVQHTNSVFIHLMRFCESGSTYYYRVRGKTGTYYTGWSDPGNFDYTFTDIKDDGNYPDEYSLSQNYPNPFNPTTKITFTIPEESRVSVTIYDLLGNEVLRLLDEQKSRGIYTMDINASELSSGVYLYRLKAGGYIQTRKMILLK